MKFIMLDEQPITLNVEFVSTGFFCDNITMQQNMDRDRHKSFTEFNCSFDDDYFILSLSTHLPQHRINLQFNLIGLYFIGGLRICLLGPKFCLILNYLDYLLYSLT
ncbi:hypothetical protein I4U23_021880 [Adineta vaga]|nr:hypothetical protein I4U23_021880 [Adineta vaga]